MSKKLLLINDLAGYGKVALSAMIPVLSHMKYEIYSLPTAIVSNTLDYGKFEILDTTEYIKNTLKVWDELNSILMRYQQALLFQRKKPESLLNSVRINQIRVLPSSPIQSWVMMEDYIMELQKKQYLL